MKVILLKDVAKIGRRFEIKEVPDGYALNKLIPKNMAQFATPENIKRIETTDYITPSSSWPTDRSACLGVTQLTSPPPPLRKRRGE